MTRKGVKDLKIVYIIQYDRRHINDNLTSYIGSQKQKFIKAH